MKPEDKAEPALACIYCKPCNTIVAASAMNRPACEFHFQTSGRHERDFDMKGTEPKTTQELHLTTTCSLPVVRYKLVE